MQTAGRPMHLVSQFLTQKPSAISHERKADVIVLIMCGCLHCFEVRHTGRDNTRSVINLVTYTCIQCYRLIRQHVTFAAAAAIVQSCADISDITTMKDQPSVRIIHNKFPLAISLTPCS